MSPFIRTLSLFTLAACSLSAQEPVTIDAIVAAKGTLVNGLAPKDFKLSEDGKDQPVTSVTPLGRVPHAVVLLFDNTTTSAAMQGNYRTWVAQFLDTSTRPDIYFEVAAYRSGAGIDILQPFTSDVGAVKTALDGTATSARLGSITTGATASAIMTGTAALGNSQAGGDALLQSQAMAESIQGLSNSLRNIRGRKVVIFFTGGQQFAQDATAQVDAALEAANHADVALYTISNNTAYGNTMSGGTGAESIRPTQYLPEALGQILQLQDHYYALTFASAPGAAGACHSLKIKVDTADADVYARKSFCAGSAPPKQLEAALAATANGNLNLSMQAPWFWSQGADRAHVDVVLDAPTAGVKVQKQKGKVHGELAVEGAAYGADGSVASRFSETLNLEFPDQKKADAFFKLPFHYENQLSLAPGKYTVKAAISPSDGVFGKTSTEITVEPRDPAKLAMGALALSRQLANAPAGAGLPADMVEGGSPLLAAGHEIVPTANLHFQKNEHIFFYTEIDEPSLVGQAPAAVSMRFRVLDKSGAVKSDSGVASVAGYIKPGKPVVPVASTVPTTGLPSGSYRLEVTASHSTGPETVTRTIDFDLQ